MSDDKIIVETSEDVMNEVAEAQVESEDSEESETPAESDAVENPEEEESDSDEETEVEAEEESEEPDEEESDDDEKESDEEEESEEPEEPKVARKSGFKKRIDKLNARNAAKDQEIFELRQRLAKLNESAETETKESKKVDTEEDTKPIKPVEDDFDTYEEFEKAKDKYVDELTDWKVEQKFKEREREKEEQSVKERVSVAQQAHNDRVKEFSEKTPDYIEVLEEGLYDFAPTAALETAVINSEFGPNIVYELAKDTEKRDALNKLPYDKLLKEIGKMEYSFSQGTATEKPSKLKSVKKSKAPRPIKAGKAKGSGVAKSLDDPNLSQKEFERLRAEQLKQKSAY